MTERKTHYTDDHKIIQAWAERHRAQPAIEEPHFPSEPLRMPRLMLRGETVDRTIRPATWEEFFQLFDEQDLVFAYSEPEGKASPLHEFVESAAFREIRGRGQRPAGTGLDSGAPGRGSRNSRKQNEEQSSRSGSAPKSATS